MALLSKTVKPEDGKSDQDWKEVINARNQANDSSSWEPSDENKKNVIPETTATTPTLTTPTTPTTTVLTTTKVLITTTSTTATTTTTTPTTSISTTTTPVSSNYTFLFFLSFY